MSKIGIIYTTFLRAELKKKTIDSICNYWNNDYHLFIGDQSFQSLESVTNAITNYHAFTRSHLTKDIACHVLPFDCGLSYARNSLINEAYKAGCEYILLTADSIEFSNKYNFNPIISFLESNPTYGLVGLNLTNRCAWEGDLTLAERFVVSPPKQSPIIYNDISFQPVEICRNFFIAKIKSMLEVPYDNNLKIAEHEDFYWRYKQAGWKCFFTNTIEANYIKDKPLEYLGYRKRMYNEFKGILMRKYGLTGWVRYIKNTH